MTRLGFHCHDLGHLETVITSNGLRRGEFYNFASPTLPELKKEVGRHGLATSVHAPLVKVPWYPRPPTLSFLCDVDAEKRQLSIRMVQETMGIAEDFGAEYVVVHFPVPSSTDGSNAEYAGLRQIAWRTAIFLSEISEAHGMPIHMEGFGPSPFLNVDFLTEVNRSFPGLLYCFDTGHMHIAAQRDGFDLYEFAEQIAPCVGSIHVWNNRGNDDYFTYGHIPVHPVQQPKDGWVDIPRILGLILSRNPTCRIILESGFRYPEALGGHDFREGVEWIKDLLVELS